MSDIIARWRDAITDPPPELWRGVVRIVALDGRILGTWFHNDRQYSPEGSDRGKSQWLDITDVPAVPLAKVQAAVDEIQKWDSVEGILCNIEKHTGVTPSVVKDSLTTETEQKWEDIICPVCGYYCLGKGGAGCIDKPSMVTP